MALLLFTSGCTLFDDHTVRAERSIDAAVWAFQSQRQRFPYDLSELQAFTDGRMSLDITPFSEVSFVHPTPEVLHIDLTAESPDNVAVSLRYAVTYEPEF